MIVITRNFRFGHPAHTGYKTCSPEREKFLPDGSRGGGRSVPTACFSCPTRLSRCCSVDLSQAARDAGVSLWEMMDYARARKVPAQYDLEDLERDLGTIHGSLGVSRAEQR